MRSRSVLLQRLCVNSLSMGKRRLIPLSMSCVVVAVFIVVSLTESAQVKPQQVVPPVPGSLDIKFGPGTERICATPAGVRQL